jgi:biopolymer transport protein TolQ
VVKLVMLVLAAMSVGCWFIIGTKLVRFMQVQRQSARFLDVFWSQEEGHRWSPERLEAIYAQVPRLQGSPLARVFHAGYVELAKWSQAGGGAGDLENVERALRRASNNEMTRLENLLPFLATTGSVGPFIGLFGTVWGIMDSFLSIAAQRGATLDVVAPGIAEALIATAIGLLAAIPAVMAYNYFLRKIRVVEAETEAFAIDLLNIVRRHFLG